MVTTECSWGLIVQGKDKRIHRRTLPRCVVGKDAVYPLHLSKVDNIILTIGEHIGEFELKRTPVHITGVVIVIDLIIEILVDVQYFRHQRLIYRIVVLTF